MKLNLLGEATASIASPPRAPTDNDNRDDWDDTPPYDSNIAHAVVSWVKQNGVKELQLTDLWESITEKPNIKVSERIQSRVGRIVNLDGTLVFSWTLPDISSVAEGRLRRSLVDSTAWRKIGIAQGRAFDYLNAGWFMQAVVRGVLEAFASPAAFQLYSARDKYIGAVRKHLAKLYTKGSKHKFYSVDLPNPVLTAEDVEVEYTKNPNGQVVAHDHRIDGPEQNTIYAYQPFSATITPGYASQLPRDLFKLPINTVRALIIDLRALLDSDELSDEINEKFDVKFRVYGDRGTYYDPSSIYIDDVRLMSRELQISFDLDVLSGPVQKLGRSTLNGVLSSLTPEFMALLSTEREVSTSGESDQLIYWPVTVIPLEFALSGPSLLVRISLDVGKPKF